MQSKSSKIVRKGFNYNNLRLENDNHSCITCVNAKLFYILLIKIASLSGENSYC